MSSTLLRKRRRSRRASTGMRRSTRCYPGCYPPVPGPDGRSAAFWWGIRLLVSNTRCCEVRSTPPTIPNDVVDVWLCCRYRRRRFGPTTTNLASLRIQYSGSRDHAALRCLLPERYGNRSDRDRVAIYQPRLYLIVWTFPAIPNPKDRRTLRPRHHVNPDNGWRCICPSPAVPARQRG